MVQGTYNQRHARVIVPLGYGRSSYARFNILTLLARHNRRIQASEDIDGRQRVLLLVNPLRRVCYKVDGSDESRCHLYEDLVLCDGQYLIAYIHIDSTGGAITLVRIYILDEAECGRCRGQA